MKYGIYYAYWEKEWGGDFIPYIRKVRQLGFDILEVACGDFHTRDHKYFHDAKKAAEDTGVQLTAGYGPRPEHNLSSDSSATVRNALAFYEDVFTKMEIAGIRSIGGAGYSYWPVDYTKQIDKAADLERSIQNVGLLADMAQNHGISLYMEVLNRFEGYLLNTAEEGVKYVQTVDRPNVKLMLDTFHMNVEEENLGKAILDAGPLLAELHVGEPNRRPPREGRFPWDEIGRALHLIDFAGPVVMEPFVTMGGQVGQDIRVWRDLLEGDSPDELDREVESSLQFLRRKFGD